MARALYHEDSYRKEFNTIVQSINGNTIMLGQTAFYPSGGGQPCDIGKLVRLGDGTEAIVTDVAKAIEGIAHTLQAQTFNVGDKVHGIIDWQRRYSLMRMHTAAHILAAIVSKLTGALITGKQLGTEESRIDFSLEDFNRSQMSLFAEEANKAIENSTVVNCYFLPKEEAMKIPGIVKLASRMPPDVPEIRIVDIVGIDIQACAGLHVATPREIGKIEVTGAENKGKANRRMYFRLAQA
jgi:misacylated tRNA(Ala) deacylase